MSEGLWGVEEVDKLLYEDDLMDGLFELYRRIWEDKTAFKEENLARREYETRLLDLEIHRQYPSLYVDMLDRVGDHPIGQLKEGCGVIMDALSIREGFRLADELNAEYDWDISLDWEATETLPTETKFIADEWFGANGGKQASILNDNVTYIGEPEVPQLSNETLQFVWSRFPDKRLHGAQEGQYTLTELTDVYEETKQVLVDIITESSHTKFVVSSDHGYANFAGSNPYTLTDEFTEILSDKFDGRFHKVTNSGLLQKLERNGITLRSHGYYIVKGHYEWTGRNDITHGGFSVPEVMTPVLEINTADTDT